MSEPNILRPGTSLQRGKYRISEVLGAGSFGITYLATTRVKMTGALGEMETQIDVAIKEFFMSDINTRAHDSTGVEGSTGNVFADYRRKFRKEAEHLSHLRHNNIVRVIDVFDENNTTYYVMQYVDGGDLDKYIEQQGLLSDRETIAILRQIGDALSYMHAHKMLHLDVKPKNIMRQSSDGHIFLIDFGLSKHFTDRGEPESSTKIGLGTEGYAPLEQAHYRLDGSFPATIDVYALGATAFKMLTGRRAPEASVILNEGFPRAELIKVGVSARLVDCIERAMAAKKMDRYASVSDMLADLDDVTATGAEETKIVENEETVFDAAAGRSTRSSTGAKSKPEPTSTPKAKPNPQPKPAPKPSFFERHKGLVAAVCAVVFAVVGFMLFNGRGGGEIPNPEPVPADTVAQKTDAQKKREAEEQKRREAEERRKQEEAAKPKLTGTIAGHNWVDLGLSVKWATCNVGASSSSAYGNYYAWGEKTTKSEYTIENSKTLHRNLGDIAGNPQYDAARAKWGG